MSGNIDLLFTGFVCTLAVLDGICSLPGVRADNQYELSAKLRNPSLSMNEIEEILKSVTNPDDVEICSTSITRILAYKIGPCRLEDFTIPIDDDDDACWYQYNGVQVSIRNWMYRKRVDCAKKFPLSLLLKEGVADEDEEIFRTIPGSFASFLFNKEKQFEGKKNYLSNCFRLVVKLAEPMGFYALSIGPRESDQELVARWSKYLNKCKRYTESFCLSRFYDEQRCRETRYMRQL